MGNFPDAWVIFHAVSKSSFKLIMKYGNKMVEALLRMGQLVVLCLMSTP